MRKLIDRAEYGPRRKRRRFRKANSIGVELQGEVVFAETRAVEKLLVLPSGRNPTVELFIDIALRKTLNKVIISWYI